MGMRVCCVGMCWRALSYCDRSAMAVLNTSCLTPYAAVHATCGFTRRTYAMGVCTAHAPCCWFACSHSNPSCCSAEQVPTLMLDGIQDAKNALNSGRLLVRTDVPWELQRPQQLLLLRHTYVAEARHLKYIQCVPGHLLHCLVAGYGADAYELHGAVPASQYDGHGIVMPWIAIKPHYSLEGVQAIQDWINSVAVLRHAACCGICVVDALLAPAAALLQALAATGWWDTFCTQCYCCRQLAPVSMQLRIGKLKQAVGHD